MKCLILFSGKNKKYSKCHLLNVLPSMQSVKVKYDRADSEVTDQLTLCYGI